MVARVTLRSIPWDAERITLTPWYCLVCGDGGATDVLLNLLLFLPLGVAARLLGWPLRTALPPMVLLTIGIEVTQATLLVGRDASLSDVLANSLGGAIGWLAAPALLALGNPTEPFAKRAAWVALALSGVVWIASGLGLRLSLTADQPWIGEPLHLWPGHEPFGGTLERATLDRLPIPDAEMAPSIRRDSLDLVLELTRTSSRVPVLPVSVIRVVDPHHRIQLSANLRHEALVFETRLRAQGWRLRAPQWEFPGAMALPLREPWRFRWIWRPDRVELESGPAADPARVERRSLPISIGLGWVFVHPLVQTVDPRWVRWTVLWLAWWFGLTGWLAGAAGPGRAIAFGVAALVCLRAAGALTSIPAPGSELLAGAAAYAVLAAGALARRATLRGRR